MDNKENKLWRLAGEIFFIFGAPAVIAGLISIHLAGAAKLAVLGAAFILSWIIFIYKYEHIIKK